MDIRIDHEQGQFLLLVTGQMGFPEKVADIAFNVGDRSIANDCMRSLYRELKSRSPLAVRERKSCFGDPEAWEEFLATDKAGNKVPSMRLKKDFRGVEVEVSFVEEGQSPSFDGAYYCLLLGLAPGVMEYGVGYQNDYLWPLAAKLRLTKKLRKDIGLEGATRRVIELDPEPKAETAKEAV